MRDLLDGLWGDDLPPNRDPQLTLLIDALVGDDESGRGDQVVVHGDGVTYRQLIEAVNHPGGGSSGLSRLPPGLLHRLEVTGALAPAVVSTGMAALPDEQCGAWELDVAKGTISYDAVTARLVGIGHSGGEVALEVAGRATMHPDDRFLVTSALDETVTTHRPYQVRFRVQLPHGEHRWLASRARPVGDPGSGAVRLVGFIAADD